MMSKRRWRRIEELRMDVWTGVVALSLRSSPQLLCSRWRWKWTFFKPSSFRPKRKIYKINYLAPSHTRRAHTEHVRTHTRPIHMHICEWRCVWWSTASVAYIVDICLCIKQFGQRMRDFLHFLASTHSDWTHSHTQYALYMGPAQAKLKKKEEKEKRMAPAPTLSWMPTIFCLTVAHSPPVYRRQCEFRIF